MSTPVDIVSNPVAGGTRLRVLLRRVERRRKTIAFLLTVPLLLYLGAIFFIPMVNMLYLSVANPTLAKFMPRTVEALSDWTPTALPPERTYAALATDLKAARSHGTFGRVGKRLNEEVPGMFGLIGKTSFQLSKIDRGPWKPVLIRIDPQWGKLPVWRLLHRESSPYTPDYFLGALDFHHSESGHVVREASYNRIYVPLFVRTLWMSAFITILALLLGYPLAYWLSILPPRTSNLLMIGVLLPFWTSLLVRITAWIVLLQSHGVVNSVLVHFGIVDDAHRPKLIYNQLGTIIVMTQVLLPIMILPLYSVMRGISPSYMRAAVSLGARPALAFWRVYMPLTLPGIGAGGLLVFILSVGYYITPALVGGQTGQFISNMIAFNVQESLNWGLAAALGVLLTVFALVFYTIYNRVAGVGRISLG